MQRTVSLSQFCLSVRPSVCPAVCQMRVLWQNYRPMMHCGYFDTTWNGSHSSFPTPTLVGGRYPFPVKYSPKVTHPFVKRRLWPISAYNVSTIRDSEKKFNYKSQLQSNNVCYKVSLCENLQQQSCSTVIPLSNGSEILARKVIVQPKI